MIVIASPASGGHMHNSMQMIHGALRRRGKTRVSVLIRGGGLRPVGRSAGAGRWPFGPPLSRISAFQDRASRIEFIAAWLRDGMNDHRGFNCDRRHWRFLPVSSYLL
jgi:hypothetical protein